MDFCTSPLSSDIKAIKEVDAYWHAVSQVMDLSDSALRYPLLRKLAKAILMEVLTLSDFLVILV